MSEPSCIYIRCRTGVRYGWGHASRSLRLALSLQARASTFCVCIGVDGTEQSHDFFAKAGIENIQVFETGDDAAEQAWLEIFRPQIALIDMLDIKKPYVDMFTELGIKTVLYDDLLENYPFGDVLICPQVLGEAPQARASGSLCQGPDYFLVPPGVMTIASDPEAVPDQARNLFVNLGGTLPRDNFEHLAKVLHELEQDRFNITVLTGFSHDFDIQAAWSQMPPNACLIPGTDKIEDVIASVDMALSASGLMKFELAAAGVPMLMVAVVDHQVPVGRDFCDLTDVGRFVGAFIDTDPSQIAAEITALSNDALTRKAMTIQGRKLVDGNADERFVQVFNDLVTSD